MHIKKLYSGYNFIFFVLLLTLIVFSFSLKSDYNIDDGLYVNSLHEGKTFNESITYIFTQPSFNENVDGVSHEYRPISSLLFFIEQKLFGKNPFASHSINLFLYVFLLWGIWHVLYAKLSENNKVILKISLLFFAVHPLHSEVICSIKCREELYVIILGFTAVYFLYLFISKPKIKYYSLMILFYFLALMSKKSGVLFLPIFIIFHYLWTKKIISKQALFLYLGWAITSVIYILIHDNLESNDRVLFFYENPLLSNKYGYLEKMIGCFHIIGKYVMMQIYPEPLSCYYGFPILPIVTLTSIFVWIGFLSFLLFSIYGFYLWKNKNLFGAFSLVFAIGILAISNIIEPIPGLFAERLAFLPSLFFAPLIVWVILKIFNVLNFTKPYQNMILLFYIVFLSFLSFNRTLDWKDNKTLFEADLKSYPNNLKVLIELANTYTNESKNDTLSFDVRQSKLIKAHSYISQALRITPDDDKLKQVKAELDCLTGKEYDCTLAIDSNILKPLHSNNYYSLSQFFENKKDTLKTIFYLEKTLSADPERLKIYETLNRLYFSTNQKNKGLDLLKKMTIRFPDSPLGYAETANFYLSEKDTLTALPFIEEAAVKSPKNPAIISFLIDYYRTKNSAKANYYLILVNKDF